MSKPFFTSAGGKSFLDYLPKIPSTFTGEVHIDSDDDIMECIFCNNEAKIQHEDFGGIIKFDCPRCGSFRVKEKNYTQLDNAKFDKIVASGWIREQNIGASTRFLTVKSSIIFVN
jgi:predicted RNA-binding Zn-ribbon protein involved in translation (DUF1610 family)